MTSLPGPGHQDMWPVSWPRARYRLHMERSIPIVGVGGKCFDTKKGLGPLVTDPTGYICIGLLNSQYFNISKIYGKQGSCKELVLPFSPNALVFGQYSSVHHLVWLCRCTRVCI